MPTLLGPRFEPDFAGSPPRMSPEDYAIWQRWRPTIQPPPIALYFDVGLGLPDELPPSNDAAQLLGWIRNNQKRADVIAERPKDVLLIELRFNATLNAVGRLAGYRLLLEQDNPFKKPVIPVLVTNRPDSELTILCQQLKITCEIA